MKVSHQVIVNHVHMALDTLVDAGLAREIAPWTLRDGTLIGVRVQSVDGMTPLGIDLRAPRDDAVAHPGECRAEDSGLYRLHARLYGEGCTAECLQSHASIAHFAAVRLAPALSVTFMHDADDIAELMCSAAVPMSGDPSAGAPVRALAEVLFP